MRNKGAKMRYWFDTEFHDDGHHIALISIGVVAEDGREYYAINAEYDPARANQWLRDHVINHLGAAPRKLRAAIHLNLANFFAVGGVPEFWAECGEYDWIVLRQLFGEITTWPSGWPYLAMDIEQWRIQLGAPPFTAQSRQLHNALEDARATRERWASLAQLAASQTTFASVAA